MFTGFLVNTVGDEFYLLALPLVLLQLGYPDSVGTYLRSGLMVSTVLAGFVVGYLVDRYATHRLLTGAYGASAAVLVAALLLLAAGADGYLVALAAAVVLGVFTAVSLAAVDAGIPRTVARPAQVRRGYSMVESARVLAGILGPAGAGLVAGLRSLTAVLGCNAVSFAVAAGLTRLGREHPTGADPTGADPTGGRRPSAWQQTVEGLRTLALHTELRIGIALSLLINVTLGAAAPLFLVRAVRELGLTAAGTSLVVVLAGLVGIAASTLAAHVGRRRPPRAVMLASVPFVAAGALVVGGARSVPLDAAAYCLLVGATIVYTVHWRTYRQEIVPPEQLGRVSAACRSIAYSGVVVGTLVVGLLQDAGVSSGPLLVGGGLLCLAGTGVVAARLRQADRLQLSAGGSAPR